MGKVTTINRERSIPEYEHLEEWVRLKVQGFIQELLKEEVEAFLGRAKYERCRPVDESSEGGFGVTSSYVI